MNKRITLLIIFILVSTLLLTGCNGSDYKTAMSLYESGQFQEAAVKFTELGDYENSADMLLVCKYEAGKALFEEASYEEARALFEELGDYEKSADYVLDCDRQIMLQKYGDVISVLDGKTWYFNGGSDTILNSISFNADGAVIAQVYYDGNGKHDNGSREHQYTVDDKSITISIDNGAELTIPYVLSDDAFTLGENEYFTLEEIDAGLQGYWKNRNSSVTLGMKSETEQNIYINNGNLTAESASLAYGSNNGEYFYYGPYQGTYTLNFGGFDTEIMHGDNWFYNIIDGKVALLYYDHVCKPSDKLPGENGYSF